MKTSTAIAVAALTFGFTTASAFAQPYDREAVDIAIQPNANGTETVVATWRYSGDASTGALDLGTDVQLLVNGNLVDFEENEVSIVDGPGPCPTPLCPGSPSCGSGIYNGSWVQLTCYQSYLNGDPTQPVCSCSGPVCTATFEVDLHTGDDVTIVVFPGRNGLQEINTSNDSISHTYDDRPRRWRRKVRNVSYTPRPGAGPGDLYDVGVEGTFLSQLDSFADTSTEAELFVNGQSQGTQKFLGIGDLTDCAFSGCGQPCAIYYGGVTSAGTCVQEPEHAGSGLGCFECASVPASPISFPNVLIAPGDNVRVILRPVPGALPELPPLPGEEGDDTWNENFQPPCPCPGDADGNGIVDVNDLSFVIFRLGTICNPV